MAISATQKVGFGHRPHGQATQLSHTDKQSYHTGQGGKPHRQAATLKTKSPLGKQIKPRTSQGRRIYRTNRASTKLDSMTLDSNKKVKMRRYNELIEF